MQHPLQCFGEFRHGNDVLALLELEVVQHRFGGMNHQIFIEPVHRFAHEFDRDGMSRAGAVTIDSREVEATATSMVVVLTYWLSFEYVRDPRNALEPENAQAALLRGAHHVLNLLVPYLEQSQRAHLQALVGAYSSGHKS